MRKHMIQAFTAIFALIVASLVGCGGGGGSGDTSTKTGYFIDSPVKGLEYTSGSTTGITDGDGMFKYEEGKPVTFKIGSMVLGSVTVTNNRVFPVDLVSGATDETHPKVTLMAQILQTLDSDGDASNGITINETARRAITQAIEVATADPSQTTSAINQLLSTATADRTRGPTSTLVSETTAKNHLQANLLQEYIGTWTGTYSGNDSGTCTIHVGYFANTPTGVVYTVGTCTSNQLSAQQGGVGTLTAMQFPSSGTFQGSIDTGAVFTGQFTRKGTMSGTWINDDHSGTWTLIKQQSSN
jgi:hypothetical protein